MFVFQLTVDVRFQWLVSMDPQEVKQQNAVLC